MLKRWLLFLLVVGVVSTSLVYWKKGRSEGSLCDFCQRAVCKGTFYRIRTSWGLAKQACCARCGLRYEKEHAGRVKRSWAADFSTGDLVPADQAVYVEGSDFTHCSPTLAVSDQQGGCFLMCHDRCLPSVVAFNNAEEAAKFVKDHGGVARTYSEMKSRV